MIRSQPVEIAGRFVGVAVQASADWHFVAVDPRLGDLHGANFASAEEAARVARLVLARATTERPRPPAAAAPAAGCRAHA